MSKKINNPEIRKKVFDKYGGHCSYCGELLNTRFHIDHIIPKRRKMESTIHGADHIDNFNPSCQSCNSSKGSMDIEKWRNEISKKHEMLLRDSSTYRLLQRFRIIEVKSKTIKFYYEWYE